MAAPERRHARTAKGERVAAGILDAAIETIAQHGCAGASMQRIADAADVDKRVLAYYFDDRDGLLAAVTERVGDRLLGAAETALADIVDPDVGFRVGFSLLWEDVVAHPRLHAAHLALVAQSITDDALRPHVVAVRERYDHLIQERATVAESVGYRWLMDKATMSEMVLAGLHGLTLDFLQRGETPQLAAALQMYQDSLQGLAVKDS